MQELERKQRERLELRKRVREERRQERAEEDALVLARQRDSRRARVKRELEELHEQFNATWKAKGEYIRSTAMSKLQQWLRSSETQMHLQDEFAELKQNYYEPPSPDNREKEVALNDPKNLVAIQIEAKLLEHSLELTQVRLVESTEFLERHWENGQTCVRQKYPLHSPLSLKQAIANVDTISKGYLSSDQLQQFLQSIGLDLPSTQVQQAARGFGEGQDGRITVQSIQQAIESPYNGVKGDLQLLDMPVIDE